MQFSGIPGILQDARPGCNAAGCFGHLFCLSGVILVGAVLAPPERPGEPAGHGLAGPSFCHEAPISYNSRFRLGVLMGVVELDLFGP